jgi:hypothetical protein
MAYEWQSVEEAAVTLGVSTRTLHRRISKGEVETRLEDGRREVLVCLPDPEPDVIEDEQVMVTDMPGVSPHQVESTTDTSIVLAQKEVQLANEKVRRTELALAAFQHTSTILQKEANRARISGRCAWAAVAILSVGVYAAIGWTATKVTEFRTNNANLNQRLDQAATTADAKTAEAEKYREERDQARQAAARMEGELTATKANLEKVKKASTQPSTFLEKLAKMAGEKDE